MLRFARSSATQQFTNWDQPPRCRFDVKLNRGNLKAESVWLTTHRCRYVTPYRGRAAGGFDDSPREWKKGPEISTRLTGLACAHRDQRRSIPGGLVSRLRGLTGAWLRHLSHRQRAGDDGRLDRARHQLLDRVSEIPVPGARRLCCDLALGAVPPLLGLGRRARRPLRSAPDHSGRDAPVHRMLARLGRAVHDRYARALARGRAVLATWHRRGAVGTGLAGAHPSHRRA